MGRVRITRLFVLLALVALLAPRAEASRTGVSESNRPSSLTTMRVAEAGLLASLAPAATADADLTAPPLFNLGDIELVERELEHEDGFGLGPLDLLGPTPLRGPPPRYPETRVRGFELLPPFRVGASPALSLWSRQACGFSCLGLASDSRYDPWGLESGGTFTADNPENKELKRRYMAGETPRTPQELAFERAVVGGAAGATAISAGTLAAVPALSAVASELAIGPQWAGIKFFLAWNALRGNFQSAIETTAEILMGDAIPNGGLVPALPRGGALPRAALREEAKDSGTLLSRAVNAAKAAGNGIRRSISELIAESPSQILKRNMVAAGEQFPPFSFATHHIVAFDAKAAKPARDHLERLGIDINAPVNGVFLRNKDAGVGVLHVGSHSDAYYQEINRLVLQAENADEAAAVLRNVADELKAGTFKPW